MDARENLEIAYRTLSAIYLSGDNVDLMAKVKETLRGTFSKVDGLEASKESDDTQEVKHECPTNR